MFIWFQEFNLSAMLSDLLWTKIKLIIIYLIYVPLFFKFILFVHKVYELIPSLKMFSYFTGYPANLSYSRKSTICSHFHVETLRVPFGANVLNIQNSIKPNRVLYAHITVKAIICKVRQILGQYFNKAGTLFKNTFSGLTGRNGYVCT